MIWQISIAAIATLIGLMVGHDLGYAHRQNDESNEAMED